MINTFTKSIKQTGPITLNYTVFSIKDNGLGFFFKDEYGNPLSLKQKATTIHDGNLHYRYEVNGESLCIVLESRTRRVLYIHFCKD